MFLNIRYHGCILLFYIVLCLALVYPILLHPTEYLIGDPLSDIWAHIWGNWRTEREFFTNFQIPYHETYINYPFGGDLYHVDLLNSFFSIPLRFLFGPIFGQNILIITQWSMGAFAMYCLGISLRLSRWTACTMGLIYAYCPFVLTLGLASGVTERLNLMWIPLYVLCFLRIVEKRNFCWVLAATGCYVFATIGCWHYGLFLFLWSILWSCFSMVSTNQLKMQQNFVEIGIKRFLPLAILCAIFSIPLSQKASGSVEGDGGIFERSFDLFWDGVRRIEVINQATFVDFFSPFKIGLWVTKNYDLLYETLYIGIATSIFAIIALFSFKRQAIFFFASAIFFFHMSLGPEIRITSNSEVFSSQLFYTVARYIPFIEAMEVPWEYSLMGIFCLAISAGFGMDFLASKSPSIQWKYLLRLEIISLFVIESFWIAPVIVPIPTSQVTIPKIYTDIAKETGGAVFDVPSRRPYTALFPGEYFFYQSIHQRPIPHAIDHTWLDQDSFWIHLSQHQQSPSNLSLMDMFGHCWEGMPGGCNILSKIQKKLQNHGYEYVILHKTKIPEERWEDTVALFDKMLGDVSIVRDDLLVRVYQFR